MKRCLSILTMVVFASGCCATVGEKVSEEKEMKTLTIRWQRLVDDKGQTCQRCVSTGKELQAALESLKKSLGTLGVEVVLEKGELDPQTCAKDISQSNRIWIGGRPLEEWLGAEVEKSLCGFCCEELGEAVECRTVVVDGQTYETIPAELAIRAGLLAGAELFKAPSEGACCQTPAEGSCCQTPASVQKKSSECCPPPVQCKDS